MGPNIGLGKQSNFTILLTFLGLEDRLEEMIVATEMIRNAHRRAGFRIARVLRARIASMSVEDFSSVSTRDIELPDEDGGTLTAFRVRTVHHGIYKVPMSQTQHLFPLE